jgi:PAS domain S-box-containing protein
MPSNKKQAPSEKTKKSERKRASDRLNRTAKSGHPANKKEKRSLVLRQSRSTGVSTALKDIKPAFDYVEKIISTIHEPLVMLDSNLRIVSLNRSFYDTFKTMPEKAKGELFFELGNGEWDIPELKEKLEEILQKQTSFEDLELKQKLPHIRERTILVNARIISDQVEKPEFVVLVIKDVTESKKREETIEQLSSFPTVNPMPIVETDITGRVLYMNPAAKKLFPDLWNRGNKHPFLAELSSAVNELNSGRREWVRRQVEFEGAWYGQTIFMVEEGSCIRIYSNDITENRRMQQALKESENKYRIVANNTYDWEFWSSPEGKYLYVSPSCKRITGLDPEEFLKDPDLHRRIIHPDERLCFDDHLRKVEGKKAGEVEYRIIRPDGAIRWIHHACQPVFDSDGNYLGHRGSNRDITERKINEEELRQLNRVLKALSDSNQAMMHATSESGYLKEVCDFIIADCGYLMAWIGFAENDENKTVRPVAQAGFEKGYLETVNITWSDTERGHGPTGTAIRTGKPAICRNMLSDPNFKPWRKEALKRGYVSSIVLPLISNGKTFGAINIYSKEPDPFSEEEIKLLTELSNDLAYGIMTLRLRLKHEQAEQALRQSEERLNRAEEIAHLGSWELDLVTNRLSWSDEVYRIFGLKLQEFGATYEAFLEAVHPDDRQMVDAAYSSSLREGKDAYEIEHRVVRKVDGEVRIIYEKCEHVRDQNGRIVRSVGMVQDITERKQAEEKLQKQAVMLANVSEAIIGFGPDMKINFWSPSAERLYGYTSSEALGHQASDLLRAVYLDITRDEAVDQLLKTGHLKADNIHHTKDGRALYIEYHATGIYNQGKELTSIVTVMHDITERKQAEEELRQTRDYLESLFNYANAPIICWDTKFKITRFNHAFERLTDHKGEEVLGKDLSILFPPESREESLDKIRRALGGEYWEVVEIPILRKAGDTRIVLWNSANIYIKDGKTILATIAQGQDITERKRAEEEIKALNESLKQHEAELSASNKELEAFVYSVSHDLRAPLRSIEGFSRALSEDYHSKLDETGKDYLRRVRGSAQHMRDLIDDLLNLSITIRAEMRREKINLSELVKTITAGLQKTQPERQVEFFIQEGLFAHGDPPLVQTVLENLLGNAWKFTANHPQARVEFGVIQLKGETVYFVRDDGAGFDMSQASKLFTPFQRLHTTTEFSGNGIGLAVVSRIVNRHGGRVWAEGEVEKGATFYFTL